MMDDEEQPHGFGEFANVMYTDDGFGSSDTRWAQREHGNEPMLGDDPTLDAISSIPHDIAVEDDNNDESTADDVMQPTNPNPPTNVDWEQMIDTYRKHEPWLPLDEYKMFPNGVIDLAIRDGETGLSVMNLETIIRPLALIQLANRANVCTTKALWTEAIETQLSFCGIRVCGTQEIHCPEFAGFIRILHVHWRFYVCIILEYPLQLTAPDRDIDTECQHSQFAGYHYLMVDQSTAIINKCS